MLKRDLNIAKLLGERSSGFLFGARGVGKTHLARHWISALKRSRARVMEIDLLQTDVFEYYLKQPHMLRLEVEHLVRKDDVLTVFVDEIQKVPALLDEVHGLIEAHKSRVRFLLSGSSARKLKRDGANLLAGRALTLKLHPLTATERDAPLDDLLRLGSLPGICVENENPEMSLRSYVSTYLREEIQQEAFVRRLDAFARFLEIAAQYHGEPINASEIGKAAGVSSNTIATYFDILQDTMLGWTLPGWNASPKKQLRTTPKFFLFDNGVANTLRGEINSRPRESSTRYGKLFECWVIQEMVRLNDYHQLDLKYSYWRTNTDVEVDIIVSRGLGQPLAAIEIKSSKLPQHKEIVGLDRFHDDYPTVPRFCFCRAPRGFTKDGIQFLPWKEGLQLLSKL